MLSVTYPVHHSLVETRNEVQIMLLNGDNQLPLLQYFESRSLCSEIEYK